MKWPTVASDREQIEDDRFNRAHGFVAGPEL